MIRFEGVTVTYDGAPRPALRAVDLHVAEGELCVVVGPTGAGKSTLLRAVNGLVPHFTGGRLAGRVTVAGRDTRTAPPRDLADVVGLVGQDPLAGFVTDTVEEELAYVMEQLAVPAGVMRKRVEETLDLLGLAGLRSRPLATLSAGEQQRVAIGAALTANPRVLVLDEPTSALDPTAAEEVLAAVTRLVDDLGVTVLLAEHRLERIVQHADSLVEVAPDGSVRHGDPADLLRTAAVAPPVVELGLLAGWSPLPLSVRDARRLAGPLRERLAGLAPARRGRPELPANAAAGDGGVPALLTARAVVVTHGAVTAVRGVDLDLHGGEVVAVMGRNGAGKSSLLWALQGAGPRHGGRVAVAGEDPAAVSAARARALVALVPQDPGDLLYLDTVAAECLQADRETGARSQGACRALLDRLVPSVADDAHPRDLSEGQRLGLVLAIQLVATGSHGHRDNAGVVLLDEPTRGLDYDAKRRFGATVRALTDQGAAVAVSSHDVEFVAEVADRVIVLGDGEVVAEGTTAEILAASPTFAPQVAKVLAPQQWLTVAEVRAALDPSTRHQDPMRAPA